MRKLLPLLVLLIGVVPVQGQITLTQASVGAIGTEYYMGLDTNVVAGFSVGMAGPNVNWDFTNLEADVPDTVRFLDPSATPYAADFPNANLAIVQNSIDGYAYLSSGPTELNILGLAGDPVGIGQTLVVKQSDPESVARFPFTYGDTIPDTSALGVTFPFTQIQGVDSVRYTSTVDRKLISDAWGTLSLDGGNYNSLRVKEIRNSHDVIEVHTFLGWLPFQDTMYVDSSYSWWNDTKGYLLCQVNLSDGQVSSVIYQDPTFVASPDPAIAAGIKVFPNPVQDRLFISFEKPLVSELSLVDLQGRTVFRRDLSGLRHELALPELPTGMYLYRIQNRKGELLKQGKLQLETR